MKSLNKQGTAVFMKLLEMTEDNYLKLDNAPRSFLPVSFEILGKSAELRGVRFDIVSMAHYYVQNGDLMADPEMTFLCAKVNRDFMIFAGSYRQDGLGINQESIRYTQEDGWRYNKILQAEHTQFAGMWLKNIKEQQNLEMP